MNIAFIDGQNLHLGTKDDNWVVDFRKFRNYLSDKYKIEKAYYLLGVCSKINSNLYENITNSNFSKY